TPGQVARNELELPAAASDRAVALGRFLASQLPSHWGRRAKRRVFRLANAVVGNLANNHKVRVRIDVTGDEEIGEAVCVVVEGTPRSNSGFYYAPFGAVGELAVDSRSWGIEQVPLGQSWLRRYVFEIPRGKRTGP